LTKVNGVVKGTESGEKRKKRKVKNCGVWKFICLKWGEEVSLFKLQNIDQGTRRCVIITKLFSSLTMD
jgi:hypothetical protein